MEENKEQILSEEEWLKLLRACDNNCEHAAAHVLAMTALAVKHNFFDLMKKIESNENHELLQEKELIRERILTPYCIEIENFQDSGTNALISIEFLLKGFNKDEVAMCQLIERVAVKSEFQRNRNVEIGVSAQAIDKTTGKKQGTVETFHCAIFDADKFELVRKSDRQAERHLGGKKPVFH